MSANERAGAGLPLDRGPGAGANAGTPNIAPETVVVYPGLLAVARRAGHARPLAFWLILRAADSAGRGLLPIDDAKRILAQRASRATFYRALADGERLGFWRRTDDGRGLLLASLARLASAQNVGNLGRTAYELPVDVLASQAGIRRAHYAALLSDAATNTAANEAARQSLTALELARTAAGDDAAMTRDIDKLAGLFKSRIKRRGPISQARLADMGAPTRRTQTRYRRALWHLGIRARRNAVRTGLHAMTPAALAHARRGIHAGCYTYGSAIVRPLPNSYTTRLQPTRTASARANNRRLSPLANAGAGQGRRQLFFHDARQAAESEHDGLILVADKLARGGLRLWDLHGPQVTA